MKDYTANFYQFTQNANHRNTFSQSSHMDKGFLLLLDLSDHRWFNTEYLIRAPNKKRSLTK